jgi:hypothetical protein
MSRASSPAIAWINDDLPEPGTCGVVSLVTDSQLHAYTVQQISSSERNTAVSIPLLAPQEIARVVKKHLFDARVKDD